MNNTHLPIVMSEEENEFLKQLLRTRHASKNEIFTKTVNNVLIKKSHKKVILEEILVQGHRKIILAQIFISGISLGQKLPQNVY
jgi:hypothetical protein